MLESSRSAAALFLIAVSLVPTPALATGDHIVRPSELHGKLVAATEARQENLRVLRKFFSSDPARRALAKARLDPVKLDRAVALLDDEELARLASRAAAAQSDFAGGALSNQEITYILIALATAVVILVIVAAR